MLRFFRIPEPVLVITSANQHRHSGRSLRRPGIQAMIETGLVLTSAMPWQNSDAKRPGMHSHAKRGNEAEWGGAEVRTNPIETVG